MEAAFLLYMRIKIVLLILPLILLAAGCSSGGQPTEQAVQPSIKVGAQSAGDSREITIKSQYPALVNADSEADILAKSAGTVKEVRISAGDRVDRGQTLFTIDDTGTVSSAVPGIITATQVRQASIAVDQAAASLNLAERNYQDLLLSSQKDLNQAVIGRDQANTGQTNLGNTTVEALKSAELALATAQTAVEQAKANLDNRKAISDQGLADTETNAGTVADSAVNTAESAIVAINNIADLDADAPVNLAYKNDLGARDINALPNAIGAYGTAKQAVADYRAGNFTVGAKKIQAAIVAVNAAKALADAAKYVFDNSVTSLNLPLNPGITGTVSLSGLQAAAAGYQSQLAGVLSQAQGAQQALTNTELGNDANLEALTKAYELALDQEKQAEQNLNNINAGNKSQLDQAASGSASAENQYEQTKILVDAQLASAKSQVDLARLSYQNAQVALQNAYDSHIIVSPINGTVTRKFVSPGDTVSFGQLIAIVSEPATVKLTIYVDKDTLPYLELGQKTTIRDNGQASTSGAISAISLSADNMTKRFPVEIKPDETGGFDYSLGTVMSVDLTVVKHALGQDNLLLPVSAVEIGQNENSIFTVRDGKAVKLPVQVVRVEGETAEIKVDLPSDALIIIRNNKIIGDGDPVSVD